MLMKSMIPHISVMPDAMRAKMTPKESPFASCRSRTSVLTAPQDRRSRASRQDRVLDSAEPMRGSPSRARRHARVLIGAASVLGALVLWQASTAWLGWIRPLFLASPATLADAFVTSLREPYGGATLIEHALVSLREVLAGFLAGIAVGIPL